MKWSAIVRSKPEWSACVTFCSIVFAPDSSMISIRCAGTSPVEILSRSSPEPRQLHALRRGLAGRRLVAGLWRGLRCFIFVTPSADTSSCALSIIHS